MRVAANNQSLIRRTIGAEIERLIAILDALDGDSDVESNGDEDDASYPESCQTPLLRFPHEDDEDGADDEWSGDEREPTLGWNNPRCGEPDREEGWLPADVSDEKTSISEPDLVSSDGAEVARQLLRQVIEDHQKLAGAIHATRRRLTT